MFKLLLLLVMLSPTMSVSASEFNLELITATNTDGSTKYSASLTTLLAMTVLAFLPVAIMTMTPFLRITIVFTMMRQALGLNTVPSNKVLVSIAMVMSLFIMRPVLEDIVQNALNPYLANEISPYEALDLAVRELKGFMLDHTMPSYLETFLALSGEEYTTKEDVSILILTPAFISSEIQSALMIGFYIFLPFVIIDLLVASVLMSLGMMMVSPIMISLPVKVLMFVLVDGWMLIVNGLSGSYMVY